MQKGRCNVHKADTSKWCISLALLYFLFKSVYMYYSMARERVMASTSSEAGFFI